MADTTLPIPSRRTPLVDRYRMISDVWWPWFDALLKTVRATSGAVTEVVDQVGGKWSLSVNVNNRVVGAITIDGSLSEPTFSIVADKFEIVHPSNDGDVIQAFVLGLVNGVSTVGINGDLMVDGTITANAINVGTLSAITADVGTLTAGVIQSADGSVVLDLTNGTFSIISP